MPALVLTSGITVAPTSPSKHITHCIYIERAFLKLGISFNNTQLVTTTTGQWGRRPRFAIMKAKSGSEESGGSGIPLMDEWIRRLPDQKQPLYSHSLPCIEAWLTSLGFFQSKEDRAVWHILKPDWHAQLSLDITDLYIRYLKSGPGNLERDVERKFSYALSREDLENAILSGP